MLLLGYITIQFQCPFLKAFQDCTAIHFPWITEPSLVLASLTSKEESEKYFKSGRAESEKRTMLGPTSQVKDNKQNKTSE